MQSSSYKELEDIVLGYYGCVRAASAPGVSGFDAASKLHSFRIVPYAYPITFTGLAQTNVQTSTINIAANADFFCVGGAYRANVGAAQNVGNKTAAFIRVLLTDTGSNDQFTNSAVDLETYFTNDAKINFWSYPRVVQGRTALQVQVTSYAPTAETYALDLVLRGALVYAFAQ